MKKLYTLVRTTEILGVSEDEEGVITVETAENEYEFDGPPVAELHEQMNTQTFTKFFDKTEGY